MTQTVAELEELVALQRQHARHGFGGLPPANIEKLRSMRARLGYLRESIDFLVAEAISRHTQIEAAYRTGSSNPVTRQIAAEAARKLMRENGVHNVPKLLAARAKTVPA
jgi:hypothetical protein